MWRGLWAVGIGVAVAGAAGLLLLAASSRGMPTGELVIATAVATLFLSMAAAAFGWRAMQRSAHAATELQRLARSIDGALSDLAARGNRDRAWIADIDARLAQAIEGPPPALPEAVAIDGKEAAQGPQGANIVPYPAMRRTRLPAAESADGIESAIQRLMLAGRAELSLQPIISVGNGLLLFSCDLLLFTLYACANSANWA